jgi:hypothetical protein
MENFEKIEAYVTGKMDAQEKEAFEQALIADPTLKSETAMQSAIIESVRKARMTELKGMLSQVPVTGVEFTLGISIVKIAATVITAGVLVGGSIFYLNQKESKTQVKTVKDSILEKIEIPATSIPSIIPKEEKKTEEPVTEKSKSVTEKSAIEKTSAKKTAPVATPKIDIVDPSIDLTKESEATGKVTNERTGVTTSLIPVETNNESKKYSFHYQFGEGKLILFGSFDKGLYEVLEVNGNTHSLFLFYKEKFYLLNEKQKQITPLTEITDSQLISKLKDYRSK